MTRINRMILSFQHIRSRPQYAHLMFATSLFVRTGSRDSRIALTDQKATQSHAAASSDPRISELVIAMPRPMTMDSELRICCIADKDSIEDTRRA